MSAASEKKSRLRLRTDGSVLWYDGLEWRYAGHIQGQIFYGNTFSRGEGK
jgi:hypothetical protein